LQRNQNQETKFHRVKQSVKPPLGGLGVKTWKKVEKQEEKTENKKS